MVVGWGLLVAGVSGFAASAIPNEGGHAVGGSVVAEASPWAWISDPAGVVAAINLDDGSRRWQGPARGLPLALHDGQLVVLAAPSGSGKMSLVIVDPETGAVDRGFSADLPDAVVASPSPLPNQRFQVWSSIDGDDLNLIWEYQSSPLRGMEMGHDYTRSQVVTLEGALILDLDNDSARDVPINRAARYFDLDSSARIAGLSGSQFRSADSVHVQAAAAVEDDVFGWQWNWRVHDRTSGRALGNITTPVSTAPFIVHGEQLIWQADPIAGTDATGKLIFNGSRLVAQNLIDGSVLWTVDIADRIYQGTLPP